MGSTDAGSVLTTSDADRGSSSLLSKNPESRPSQPPSSASDLSAAGAGCRTAGSELLLVLVETTAAVEAASTLTGAAGGEAAERSTAASDVRVVTAAMPSAVVLAGSLVVAAPKRAFVPQFLLLWRSALPAHLLQRCRSSCADDQTSPARRTTRPP